MREDDADEWTWVSVRLRRREREALRQAARLDDRKVAQEIRRFIRETLHSRGLLDSSTDDA